MYDRVQENNVEQYPHDVELALTVFKNLADEIREEKAEEIEK